MSTNNDGPLALDHIWGLDDGRIIISISEPVMLGPFLGPTCRRLLCYTRGTWSFIEPPDQTLYNAWWLVPLFIRSDDQGHLLVYTDNGEQLSQTCDESGSVAWQSVDISEMRSAGVSTLLDDYNLLVYGSEEVKRLGCTECPRVIKPPCSIKHYGLSW